MAPNDRAGFFLAICDFFLFFTTASVSIAQFRCPTTSLEFLREIIRGPATPLWLTSTTLTCPASGLTSGWHWSFLNAQGEAGPKAHQEKDQLQRAPECRPLDCHRPEIPGHWGDLNLTALSSELGRPPYPSLSSQCAGPILISSWQRAWPASPPQRDGRHTKSYCSSTIGKQHTEALPM